MPPTAEPTTGRDLYIASATVRPKPSAVLFCATTCRVALQHVHRRRRAVGIVHRNAREMDSLARIGREPAPDREAVLQDFVRLGVVSDAGALRPGQDEVRVGRVHEVPREPAHHALHVLHRVPSRRLEHDGHIGRGRRPREHVCGLRTTPRAVAAGEGIRRLAVGSREQTDVGQDAGASSGSMGSFLAENGSIDGGMTGDAVGGSHERRELCRENT